jgi:hypothetical protein
VFDRVLDHFFAGVKCPITMEKMAPDHPDVARCGNEAAVPELAGHGILT